MTAITVSPAYQGIPGVAHGGYTAGLFAARLPGHPRVTLRRPPPIGTPLTVTDNGSGPSLRDPDSRTVMLARPATGLALDLPVRTVSQVADQAPHPGYHRHPYPGCFMCGTERPDGFKLRVATGDDGVTSGLWRPSSPLLPDREEVPAEFVWAAIDCLTAWAFADRWQDRTWWPAVTGQLTVALDRQVRRDADHVVVARVTGRDGRRITVQATVSDARGRACARAEAVWVVVPDSPGDPAGASGMAGAAG
jgi:hypothetical protein